MLNNDNRTFFILLSYGEYRKQIVIIFTSWKMKSILVSTTESDKHRFFVQNVVVLQKSTVSKTNGMFLKFIDFSPLFNEWIKHNHTDFKKEIIDHNYKNCISNYAFIDIHFFIFHMYTTWEIERKVGGGGNIKIENSRNTSVLQSTKRSFQFCVDLLYAFW